MIFTNCLRFTLQWEGGYVNNPADHGGHTNQGVTQRVYDSWRIEQGLPPVDVKHITPPEVEEIYKNRYWHPIYGGNLPPQIALACFDLAVNSGPSLAAKYLQKSLGITADGVVGPQTLAAVEGAGPEVALRICDLREALLRSLATHPGQSQFLRGWLRRVDALRAEIRRM